MAQLSFPNRIRVSLCMIVKNESHCIRRLLERYASSLDAVAIIDTGSNDGTVQIIEDFLKETGICGIVESRKWYEFHIDRNFSLSLVPRVIRKYYQLPLTGPLTPEEYALTKEHIWYTHITDADNLPIKNEYQHLSDQEIEKGTVDIGEFNIKEYIIETGEADSYDVELRQSGTSYGHRGLIPSNALLTHGYAYYCPRHEYKIQRDASRTTTVKMLKGFHIVSGRYGNRSRNPVKFQEDALILQKALLTKRLDPEDVDRCVFYLAQSLKDAGVYDESIKQYRKRAEMKTGWYDERYISRIRVASLMNFTSGALDGGIPNELVTHRQMMEYHEAYQISPDRREAACELMKFYHKRDLFHVAWNIIKPSIFKNEADPNRLFVDLTLYGYEIDEKAALCAFYTGDLDSFQILMERALQDPKIPDSERERIAKNRCFYPPKRREPPPIDEPKGVSS